MIFSLRLGRYAQSPRECIRIDSQNFGRTHTQKQESLCFCDLEFLKKSCLHVDCLRLWWSRLPPIQNTHLYHNIQTTNNDKDAQERTIEIVLDEILSTQGVRHLHDVRCLARYRRLLIIFGACSRFFVYFWYVHLHFVAHISNIPVHAEN